MITFDSSNFQRERGVESESGQWRGKSDKYFWGEEEDDVVDVVDKDDQDGDGDVDVDGSDNDNYDEIIGNKENLIADRPSTGRASPSQPDIVHQWPSH